MTRRTLLGTLAWPAASEAARIQTLAGISFEVIRNKFSNRRYLFIHGDEETARQVLRDHMRHHAGIAYLVTGRERHVPVRGGKLDPNRMFSRVGAARNLKTLNPEWTEKQMEAELARLDRQRGQLLTALLPPPGGVLIAVHNNSQGYSVNVEIPISDETSIHDPANPHEFFLATSADDFRVISQSPYNAVLQKDTRAEDDGSMSRLMAARGLRYVNLEVALGKAEKQAEMLSWLVSRLP